MEPKVKDTPGSQGTLFGGGYTSDATFKGYDADRLHAVRDAVSQGIRPGNLRAYGFAGHHEVVDTLARSTVPVEHIAARGAAGSYHDGSLAWATNQSMNDALGKYRESGYGPGGQPTVVIKRGQERSPTVIHELGHHVSKVTRTEHSAYETPAQQGHEEGFAEAYAMEHYRGRRGEPKEQPSNPGNWSVSRWPTYAAKTDEEYEDRLGKVREFDSAYRQHMPAAAPATLQPRPSGLPPEHVEGQLPLLQKVTTEGHYDYANMRPTHTTRWDYNDDAKERGMRSPLMGR